MFQPWQIDPMLSRIILLTVAIFSLFGCDPVGLHVQGIIGGEVQGGLEIVFDGFKFRFALSVDVFEYDGMGDDFKGGG
jgi:hypothetical protein